MRPTTPARTRASPPLPQVLSIPQPQLLRDLVLRGPLIPSRLDPPLALRLQHLPVRQPRAAPLRAALSPPHHRTLPTDPSDTPPRQIPPPLVAALQPAHRSLHRRIHKRSNRHQGSPNPPRRLPRFLMVARDTQTYLAIDFEPSRGG